jgi:hypothetical protein
MYILVYESTRLLPIPKLEKKKICGRHFRSVEDVEDQVNGKDSGFFRSGMMALEH